MGFLRYSRHITKGRRWQVFRMAILERDYFACRNCGSSRRLEVHHVKSVRTAPELAWDPDNCKTLCASCHTRATRQELGQPLLSEERQEWRRLLRQSRREFNLSSK